MPHPACDDPTPWRRRRASLHIGWSAAPPRVRRGAYGSAAARAYAAESTKQRSTHSGTTSGDAVADAPLEPSSAGTTMPRKRPLPSKAPPPPDDARVVATHAPAQIACASVDAPARGPRRTSVGRPSVVARAKTMHSPGGVFSPDTALCGSGGAPVGAALSARHCPARNTLVPGAISA